LVLIKESDGSRLFAAMTLSEAQLGDGSRVLFRSSKSAKLKAAAAERGVGSVGAGGGGGGGGGLRDLLAPPSQEQLTGKAKTYALEMEFGGGAPSDPCAEKWLEGDQDTLNASEYGRQQRGGYR